MKKVLVDTENISNYEVLTEMDFTNKDEIILFISSKSKSLKSEAMMILTSLKAKLKFINIDAEGSNSMDFQMIFFLGKIYNGNNEYYIFSNDSGFNACKNFSLNYYGHDNIFLIKEDKVCSSKKKSSNSKKKKKSSSKENDLSSNKVISLCETKKKKEDKDKSEKVEKIKSIARKCKDNAQLHNELVKIYGEEGKSIYKSIKNKNIDSIENYI